MSILCLTPMFPNGLVNLAIVLFCIIIIAIIVIIVIVIVAVTVTINKHTLRLISAHLG